MELCSVSCASLDGSGLQGRTDTCICTAEFLCCSPETTITVLIVYTQIQSGFGVKNFFFKIQKRKVVIGTSLAVQWLRLCTSTKKGVGSIPGLGTKIPHVAWHSQETK